MGGLRKRTSMIPSAGPSITDLEVRLVTQAVRDGWYERMSDYLDQFERAFSDYTGMRYCLATNTCTGALHLALLGLGVGPGHEIIVPDITWVASAAPICYTGAKPVFVDIDRTSWCLAPESVERAITKKTKAVIAVGLMGNLPDFDAIRSIAARHHIPIIEDAAQSIGAEYHGQKAGTFGTVGVFSFNGTKLLVTGEGGMLVTNDRSLYGRLKRLQHHGIDKEREGKYFWSYELGYKYKMSNLQAALGLAQLRRIDELVAMRRRIFAWYQQRLRWIEGLQLNQESPGLKSTFWLVTVILSSEYGLKKEPLMERLRGWRIDSRPFFYPLSSMPTFARYCRGNQMWRVNQIAYALSPYGISLPSAASLTESDVAYVCDVLKDLLVKSKAKTISHRAKRTSSRVPVLV